MGIKGIYKEIGPGQRVSLCKLAVDHLENTGQPFRLAIDFSIWQFQVQAARGGANPAIRTLFYRLVRLLGLAIRPIFVFDGPHKPAFKRNKRSVGRGSGAGGDAVATAMAKRLIRLFGFATHDAPGEAEAECALLEQQGVVDAVLSEDVDTIMFGCRRTLRNWTAEGMGGAKTPTHVSVYEAGAVAGGPSGLDREGMVLVALMSGGDYLPEGVPGCGVKVACEAAKAGFGKDLCRIKRADRDGLAEWKQRLLHELRTNESGYFRTRHKALEIPESFPNMEILRYYTHPKVSLQATVDRLKREFPPESTVDVVGLREFTRETFDWQFKGGAVKLIRVLAPSLLVDRFLERYISAEGHHDDLDLKQKEESALVRSISSKRAHFSTDATPELRISFVPGEIVKLDLGAEPEEEVEAFGRSGIALNSDDEFDEEAEELGDSQPKAGSSKKPFDPLQPELAWIPHSVAKLGVPLTVEDWEAKQRSKEQRVATKATGRAKTKNTGMPVGALDKYVKVTKAVAGIPAKEHIALSLATSPPRSSSQPNPTAPRGRSKQPKKTPAATQVTKPSAAVNPWSLASLQTSPRTTKSFPSSALEARPKPVSAKEPIILSSSPAGPASPPTARASVTSDQVTPTRTKRLHIPPLEGSPPPPPSFTRSSSPRKQEFSRAETPAEAGDVDNEAKPGRKSRPFKRVKSGADGKTASGTQTSIKTFGRVSKNMCSTQEGSKAFTAVTQPIEILSDDDEFPPPLPKPQPARNLFSQGTGSADIAADNDPFVLPLDTPQLAHSTSLPSEHGNQHTMKQPTPPAHPADTETSTDDLSISTTDPAPAENIPAATKDETPAASTKTSTGTTKLFIPRTSLNGMGYFSQVEVDRDEADSVMAAHNGASEKGLGHEQMKRKEGSQRRKAWRLSELEVLDLTGED